MSLVLFVLGVVFALALSRGGATDYDFIQRMFLFQDFQLYGIIGVAVVVAAPGLWLLSRRGRALGGQPLEFASKGWHGGILWGGALFGVGWALTGMCPGPMFVTIGEGKLYGIAALAGALTGTWLFGLAYPKLQRPLRLPSITEGTGQG